MGSYRFRFTNDFNHSLYLRSSLQQGLSILSWDGRLAPASAINIGKCLKVKRETGQQSYFIIDELIREGSTAVDTSTYIKVSSMEEVLDEGFQEEFKYYQEQTQTQQTKTKDIKQEEPHDLNIELSDSDTVL